MGLLDDALSIIIPGWGLAKVVTEQVAPGQTISVEKALTTGDATQIVTKKEEGPPGFALDFISTLIDTAQKDPKALAGIIRPLLVTVAGVAAAISFIPTNANLGGPLASRIIGDFVQPFQSKVYNAPISDMLDNFFPTAEAPTRTLVSGIEAGAFGEEELMEELVDAGTKDRSIRIITRYARVKRFETATRDDVALLRRYEQSLETFTIGTLQDEIRGTINDLRDRRRELGRELRRIGGS